jgi:hypothetical protein
MHSRLWWGNQKESDTLEDVNVDGKIMLNWVLKK